MGYGWEGEAVRSAPLDKERHLANASAWLNDPDVTEWTLLGDMPITRLAEEEFFDRVMREDSSEVTSAVETPVGGHIGFAGFHRIDRRHGVGFAGAVIGRYGLYNRGLGADIVRVRTGFVLDILGLRLLLGEVMGGNTASERMLVTSGYREVGRIPRRCFKRGRFRGAVIFALERWEWTARVEGCAGGRPDGSARRA